MALLDALFGNASKIDPSDIQADFAQVLTTGEVIEHAYRLIRDLLVFTNKRLILVDKQGLTGSKIEYHSIPYHSISRFSVEAAGTLDMDAELKLWLSGSSTALQKTFSKRLNILEVQSVLASYVLR
ncbi:MAG TPA: cytoplasmic protein [Xanthomonadales bacterium]|nr:cytoplasmic protein [Xanthomonadales bacterium]